MKNLFRNSIFSAVIMAVGSSMGSCVSENPFETSSKFGEGTLKLSTSIKGDVSVSTRAEGYDQATLENNLVVYVERLGEEAALVRKYNGLSSIPSSIMLSAGDYAVEGWTGDSISASWDKKFYRGYQKVKINPDQTENLSLTCAIANVLVSVDKESLDAGISDLNIAFYHSRKGVNEEYVLNFGENEITSGAKGYFMMPTEDHVTGKKESVLHYEITGSIDGEDFNKAGDILGVASAHEYVMKIEGEQSEETSGGALIKLDIVDIPVIDANVEILPPPEFANYYGSEKLKQDEQIDLTSGVLMDAAITSVAYGGLRSVVIYFNDQLLKNVSGLGSYNGMVLNLNSSETQRNNLESNYGIVYDRQDGEDPYLSSDKQTIRFDEVRLTLPASFFSLLPKSEVEYAVTLEVTDDTSIKSSTTLRFANTEAAIDHPAPVGAPDLTKNEYKDLRNITPYSAVLTGEVYIPEEASNYGIKYRERGTDSWTELSGGTTRAGTTFTVKASNLKPGTTYEYKAYCDGFEEKSTRTFTTESVYDIPNASFESWSDYSAQTMLGKKTVILPGAGGDKLTSFWGSGNEGGATAGKVLTNKSTDMVHSGTYSARLGSDAAMGIIAAGNIFAGYYVETDGTNGVLSVGRPYNGSHPSKLKVWANYRPASGVSVKDGNENFVPANFAGGNDHGQIYVALTTAPIEIRTNPDKRHLFNKDEAEVLAYGEVTWTGNFGPDGALEAVEIPIEYKDAAKTTAPTHLVIVVSASKYGDYFSGAKGSVMYLDDFELVYE